MACPALGVTIPTGEPIPKEYKLTVGLDVGWRSIHSSDADGHGAGKRGLLGVRRRAEKYAKRPHCKERGTDARVRSRGRKPKPRHGIVAGQECLPLKIWAIRASQFVVRAMIVLQSGASNVGARLLRPGHPRGARRLHFAGRVLGTLVRADGDDFDFDQDAGGRKGCYLECAASGLVGLFLCAEIFCVGGHEAGEIHFVVLRRIAN